MSQVSRALLYQLQHRARWAELSIPLTVRTAFEKRTLGQRPGVLGIVRQSRRDSDFYRTTAGNRAVGLSVSLAGRGPPKNRGGVFRFRGPRAAPPSVTIRHLHDQRVRRQGDTL